MEVEQMGKKWLSRKFLMTVGLIIVLFVFLWFGKVTEGVAIPFIAGLSAVYTGANVVQKKDKGGK